MAKKSSADHLKHAKMRLEASKKWRKQDGYDALWKRMNDLYSGKHFDDYKSEDQMLVNIAF